MHGGGVATSAMSAARDVAETDGRVRCSRRGLGRKRESPGRSFGGPSGLLHCCQGERNMLTTVCAWRSSAHFNRWRQACSYQKLFFCPYQTLAFFHCGLLPAHPMLHLNHWL